MPEVSANDLTKTHYCKASGCENEVSSPVGRYSYCKEHQGTASAGKASTNGSGNATTDALRDLISLAKSVDKARAKADGLRRKANLADKEADALESDYTAALSAAARRVQVG